MRKLLLFFILIGFTMLVQAKDIPEYMVPQNVKSYVSDNYGKVNYVEWEFKDKKNYYKAEFREGGREIKLKIASSGELLYSKEDMLIKDIPAFAVSYIKENYEEAKILGANKKYENGQFSYDVGIKYSSFFGYGRHRNIIFDEKGNVLRK